jgi:hypothetical protein
VKEPEIKRESPATAKQIHITVSAVAAGRLTRISPVKIKLGNTEPNL